MNKQDKQKIRKKTIEQLEKEIKELKLSLSISSNKCKGSSKGTPTNLLKDIRKNISFYKTIVNEKKQLQNSIILCEGKTSKRRLRRLKGKLKGGIK